MVENVKDIQYKTDWWIFNELNMSNVHFITLTAGNTNGCAAQKMPTVFKTHYKPLARYWPASTQLWYLCCHYLMSICLFQSYLRCIKIIFLLQIFLNQIKYIKPGLTFMRTEVVRASHCRRFSGSRWMLESSDAGNMNRHTPVTGMAERLFLFWL